MNENFLTQKKLSSELLSLSNSQAYAQVMARLVDINEAGISFPELADHALAGEEIVFSKGGKPVLKLVSLNTLGAISEPEGKMNRTPGAWAHYDPDFDIDAWDALDEDVRKLFTDMP
jgi:antitoxin (DNA-binding transcriptional repressor) of toxin-antitoxin stability system